MNRYKMNRLQHNNVYSGYQKKNEIITYNNFYNQQSFSFGNSKLFSSIEIFLMSNGFGHQYQNIMINNLTTNQKLQFLMALQNYIRSLYLNPREENLLSATIGFSNEVAFSVNFSSGSSSYKIAVANMNGPQYTSYTLTSGFDAVGQFTNAAQIPTTIVKAIIATSSLVSATIKSISVSGKIYNFANSALVATLFVTPSNASYYVPTSVSGYTYPVPGNNYFSININTSYTVPPYSLATIVLSNLGTYVNFSGSANAQIST